MGDLNYPIRAAQQQQYLNQLAQQQQGGQHGIGSTTQALYNNPYYGAGGGAGQSANLSYSDYSTSAVPIENAGIRVGEIIGYRMWQIKDGYLLSYSASHAWPPGEVMMGDPKENNSEGIWAFKEKSRALNKMLASRDAVMGSIKMWGRIIEYTQGYRVEFAKIVSIEAMSPRDDKLIKQLQKDYGVAK